MGSTAGLVLFMALVILCLRRRNQKRAERWAGGGVGEDAPAEQGGSGEEPKFEGGGDAGGDRGGNGVGNGGGVVGRDTGVGPAVPVVEVGGGGGEEGWCWCW